MCPRAVPRALTSPRILPGLVAAAFLFGASAGRPADATTDEACSTLATRLALAVDALVADLELEASRAETLAECRAKCGRSRNCRRCDSYGRAGATWKARHDELRREAAELQIVHDGQCGDRDRAR